MLFKGLPYINHISIYFFYYNIFSNIFPATKRIDNKQKKDMVGDQRRLKKKKKNQTLLPKKKTMFLLAQVTNKQRKLNSENKNKPFSLIFGLN